jgi:hypothetical protein
MLRAFAEGNDSAEIFFCREFLEADGRACRRHGELEAASKAVPASSPFLFNAWDGCPA